MPRQKRQKTRYPGVYYIVGQAVGKDEPERIYYIQYRRNGRLIEEKAGRQFQDDMTPARASSRRIRRLRGEELSNTGRREEEQAVREAEANRWTFARLFETYNEVRRGGKADSTDKANFAHLADLHDKEPGEVLPLEVDRIRNRLEKREKKTDKVPGQTSEGETNGKAGKKSKQKSTKKPGTVKKVLALLVRLSRFGQKKRLTAPLPFLVELPKVHDEKTEFLTPEESARLVAVLDSWPDPHQAAAMRLSFLTGLRRGDVFNLRWNDVNFTTRTLRIREPKNEEPATIPASRQVINLLGAHPRSSSPFVFHGLKGARLGIRIKKDGSGNWPREIAKAAGLPDDFRSFYGLRHTFASTLASEGTNLYTIQKLLTQKSPQMTKRYAHLRDEPLRKAADTAGRVLTRSKKK